MVEYKLFKKQEINGKKRNIYKKKGSNKQYIKYKGKMMNLIKYKKLKKNKVMCGGVNEHEDVPIKTSKEQNARDQAHDQSQVNKTASNESKLKNVKTPKQFLQHSLKNSNMEKELPVVYI
jgi:hypothetical protein